MAGEDFRAEEERELLGELLNEEGDALGDAGVDHGAVVVAAVDGGGDDAAMGGLDCGDEGVEGAGIDDLVLVGAEEEDGGGGHVPCE